MFQKMFDYLVASETYDGVVSYQPTAAGNVALFVLILLLFIAMLSFSGSMKQVQAKQLAFSAVAMTLAVVTSMYTIGKLPYGGSFTFFRMFFLIFIGYLYGPKVGILTGVAYGFLELILDPYIIGPIQLFLDYPIAFGCLGLSGVFSKSKYGLLKGYILGVFGRYLCHVITGFVFFADYAPDHMNPIFYSLGYNATYILPEAIATVIIISIPSVIRGLQEVKRYAL